MTPIEIYRVCAHHVSSLSMFQLTCLTSLEWVGLKGILSSHQLIIGQSFSSEPPLKGLNLSYERENVLEESNHTYCL